MKKMSILTLLSTMIIALLGACSTEALENNSIPELGKPQSVVAENDFHYDLNELDTIIKLADDIIVGKIEETEDFDSFTQKYKVVVENVIKGELEIENSISLYENDVTLKLGDSILLFLEFFDSTYYPEPIYTSIGKNTIVLLDEGEIVNDGFLFEGFKNPDELIFFVKNSIGISYDSNSKITVMDKVDDHKELIRQSDYIIRIIPTKVNAPGTRVSSFQFEVKASYKSPDLDYEFINLPSFIEIGEEYLVYLKEYREDSIQLTSREGSLLLSTDEEWKERIGVLESMEVE